MLDTTFFPHFFWPFKRRLCVNNQGQIIYGAKKILLTDITSIVCGETQLYTYQRKANRWSTIILVSPHDRLKIHFSSIGWLHSVRGDVQGLYMRIMSELEEPVIKRIGNEWIQTLTDGGAVSVGRVICRKTGVQIGNKIIPWHMLSALTRSGYLELIAPPENRCLIRLDLSRIPNAIVLSSFFSHLKNIFKKIS